MPGTELEAGIAYQAMVHLTDAANRPEPKWGVTWNDLTVAYCGYGGTTLTTKSVVASDWLEIGCGLYRLRFSSDELATSGEWAFIVTERPVPQASFDDYPGNIYVPVATSGSIETDIANLDGDVAVVAGDVVNLDSDVVNLQSDVTVIGGNLSVVNTRTQEIQTLLTTVAADLSTAKAYLLGRIVWDFSTDPWTITVYDEDNVTLIATFSYTNNDANEERRRL